MYTAAATRTYARFQRSFNRRIEGLSSDPVIAKLTEAAETRPHKVASLIGGFNPQERAWILSLLPAQHRQSVVSLYRLIN
jgi:hypothetical protein